MSTTNTTPAQAGEAQAMPETSVQPSQAAPAMPVKEPSGGTSFFVDLLVMAFIAALVSIAVTVLAPRFIETEHARVEDRVVTVNFEALLRDQITALSEKVRTGEVQASRMADRSEAFTRALLGKVNEQAAAGKIVLRSEQVLAAPDAVLDLTDRFREELIREGWMDALPSGARPAASSEAQGGLQ